MFLLNFYLGKLSRFVFYLYFQWILNERYKLKSMEIRNRGGKTLMNSNEWTSKPLCIIRALKNEKRKKIIIIIVELHRNRVNRSNSNVRYFADFFPLQGEFVERANAVRKWVENRICRLHASSFQAHTIVGLSSWYSRFRKSHRVLD